MTEIFRDVAVSSGDKMENARNVLVTDAILDMMNGLSRKSSGTVSPADNGAKAITKVADDGQYLSENWWVDTVKRQTNGSTTVDKNQISAHTYFSPNFSISHTQNSSMDELKFSSKNIRNGKTSIADIVGTCAAEANGGSDCTYNIIQDGKKTGTAHVETNKQPYENGEIDKSTISVSTKKGVLAEELTYTNTGDMALFEIKPKK